MPTAIHSFSAEEIMAHLDGELSATRSVAVAQHLEECGECQNLVSELRGVSRDLAEWSVETSDAVVPKFAEQLRTSPRRAWWQRPAVAICAAATVLIGVVVTARMHTPARLMSRAAPASEQYMAYEDLRMADRQLASQAPPFREIRDGRLPLPLPRTLGHLL